MTTTEEQAKSPDAGCYSIEYPDPSDSDWRFSMDYNWRANEDTIKNQWTCSDSPTGYVHWTLLRGIPEHAYHALLNHFGLKQYDVSLEQIMVAHPSPAYLVCIRRAKEVRDGLVYKIIMNMRMGCPKGELADTFEAR